MLHLHHGNRTEALAAALAGLLRTPAAGPFEPELVAVQSAGLGRWLALRIAAHLGVCANVRFPFPAALMWELLRGVLGDLPAQDPYAPEVNTWRLFALLGEPGEDPALAPVRAYLAGGDELRRLELAARVAAVFDRYLVYRPDWIEAWEQGGEAPGGSDARWQALLWRRLVAMGGSGHWVHVRRRLDAALAHGLPDGARLPARVCLFGVPALSRGYLEVLHALAAHVDVHLFVLDPCRAYWGDLVSEKARARRLARAPAEADYLDVGNPLLASLGRQGRDHVDMIIGADAQEHEVFVEPQDGTALATLQGDILDLCERGTECCPAVTLRAGDESLAVHVCHGPMREVEVLRDHLYALFESEPDLDPADVVVMTPDIETYAPCVDAVFGTSPPERRIPYVIADRGAPAESPLVAVFLSLLAAARGRFEVNEILAPLDSPAVRARFALDEGALERVHAWARETGIRWGADGAARAALGLPASAEHTWRAGLDRLLLGVALPAGERALFAGVLPYDEVEGAEARTVGRLAAYVDALTSLRDALAQTLPAAGWSRLLSEALERFLAPDEDEADDLQRLRRGLHAPAENAARAGFDAPVGADVALALVRDALAAGGGARRFLSGGVTFCTLTPMRSIPFEVVCLLGMDHDAYPRAERRPDFDLMAGCPRRGDRSRRNDDRYLFLETLLCARRRLYLSYVGQDIRDNGSRPPSVLVSELLDCVDAGFRAPDGSAASAALVTMHPLQAFSPRYFEGDSRLFSYAGDLCEALRERGSRVRAPFVPKPLPAPAGDWQRVALDSLVRFFANPARHLLRERLGVLLEEGEGLLEGSEPFVLSGLPAWQLDQRLLDAVLHGTGDTAESLARAAGALPQGEPGHVQFERRAAGARAFAATLAPLLAGPPLESVDLAITLGDWHLHGQLAGLRPQGLVDYRYGRLRGRDRVATWIRHLALCAVAPSGMEARSRLLTRDEMLGLAPLSPARSREHLAELLALYGEGTSAPLPFFPDASWVYARGGGADPLARARQVFHGNRYADGEGTEPYVALAFRDHDPIDARFEAVSRRVFEPLLAAMEPGS